MTKKKKIIIITAGTLLLLAFILYKVLAKSEEEASNITPNNYAIETDIVVEIKGEVKKPNIYHMKDGDRVYELIEIAGGYTSNADDSKVNKALKLVDEMVIYIPSIIKNNDSSKVSLNNATLEELMTLSSIGEAKALNIIKYREEKGFFNTIEEIMKVPGISETIFEKIKDDITI